MKVIFRDCKGMEESMLFIIIASDEGKELLKYPVYLNKEMTKTLPILKESYSELPELFKSVYESGKRNEEIEFIEEDIEL